MKNNKGFTLVELIGVIVILAAISLIAFPLILEQVRKTQTSLDRASEELIITSAELYVDKNQGVYPRIVGNVYCISLNTLVASGELKSSVVENIDKGNIKVNETVKVSVTAVGYEFELVTSDNCTAVNN